MKKFLLILGMATCLLGMTACGEEADVSAEGVSAEELEAAYTGLGIEEYVASLDDIVEQNAQSQVAGNAVYEMGLTAWEAAKEDLGTFNGITGHTITSDGEEMTVTMDIDGEFYDAQMIMVIDTASYVPTSITVNVSKPMSELMTNAALNTLLGMGTVFIVLILIAGLISCFRFISVLEKKAADKKAKKTAQSAPAAEPVAAVPVVETVEEDDCELVAVIAAAIAASEGAASTDGFVVRSIKRRAGKWQKA
ncbi:MAG: OadG family protein [Eubacteriales bacterium]|nr:OadG family protein [Eubacteriales bacterium]